MLFLMYIITIYIAKKDDAMQIHNVTISADSPIINVTYLLGKYT